MGIFDDISPELGIFWVHQLRGLFIVGPPTSMVLLVAPTPSAIIMGPSTTSGIILGPPNPSGIFLDTPTPFIFLGTPTPFGIILGPPAHSEILDFLGPAVACEIFNPNSPITNFYNFFTHCPTSVFPLPVDTLLMGPSLLFGIFVDLSAPTPWEIHFFWSINSFGDS